MLADRNEPREADNARDLLIETHQAAATNGYGKRRLSSRIGAALYVGLRGDTSRRDRVHKGTVVVAVLIGV